MPAVPGTINASADPDFFGHARPRRSRLTDKVGIPADLVRIEINLSWDEVVTLTD